MLRRWLIGGLSLGLMASALLAKPGVVTNRQGQTFTGDVTEDDQFVYVNGTGGQLRLDKRNVDKVQYAISIDDQYNTRHAKLGANDVKGRIDLANWANDNQRVDMAIAALTEARKIDPTNREAALALDADQRQMDLDQAAASKTKKTATVTPPAAAGATPPPSPTPPPAPAADAAPALEHRLLNADEINIVRQKEMATDDAKIKVKFENGVVKRYLAAGDHDPKAFYALSALDQANEMIAAGDPKLLNDIRIVTDPAPLLEFKIKIQPLIAQGCGSTACHGGGKAGNFALYSGESTPALYTNFFILQTYSKVVNKVKFQAMDREVPEHSLVLQYGLPYAIGTPPHPRTPNFKPKFHTTDDVTYQTLYTFLNKSLRLPQPDYGIKVLPNLPATQPADGN